MMDRSARWPLATGFICSVLAACTVPSPPPSPGTTTWKGTVDIRSDVTLPRGSRLILLPGTVVRFAHRDDDGDGWGDASLRVEGDLIARGTPEQPVVFTNEEAPAEPGGWGEIRIDFGSFDLRYVVMEGSTRGLHAHFSKGRVEDTVFRRNVDGTRFGESVVTVANSLFYGHPGKALNARRCRNRVIGNTFHHNRNGVFLFEADEGSVFEGNVFRENQRPFRLGDFFEGTVRARGNDWGGFLPGTNSEPTRESVARLELDPGVVKNAGPRAWPVWAEAWKVASDGFVDAAPVLADEGVYGASWDGSVFRLGFLDGKILASTRLADVVDSAPALSPRHLAVQCWDRGVYLLDRSTLRVLDVYREETSAADDHRQSSPVFSNHRLFVATWAGTVRAFDTSGGRLEPLWSFRAKGPFRAGLTLAPGLLLAPCQDGTLYALRPDTGAPRWVYRAGAPLLSSPAIDEDRIFLGDKAGQLHALQASTGQHLWKARLRGSVWYAPPLLLDGVLYQGSDAGALQALDPTTGRILWSRELGGGIRARPAPVGGGQIAAPTLSGRLYLLDAPTGLERDCWEIPEPVHSSPATAGARVTFGGRDGFMRAMDVRVWKGSEPR